MIQEFFVDYNIVIILGVIFGFLILSSASLFLAVFIGRILFKIIFIYIPIFLFGSIFKRIKNRFNIGI